MAKDNIKVKKYDVPRYITNGECDETLEYEGFLNIDKIAQALCNESTCDNINGCDACIFTSGENLMGALLKDRKLKIELRKKHMDGQPKPKVKSNKHDLPVGKPEE